VSLSILNVNHGINQANALVVFQDTFFQEVHAQMLILFAKHQAILEPVLVAIPAISYSTTPVPPSRNSPVSTLTTLNAAPKSFNNCLTLLSHDEISDLFHLYNMRT